MTTTLRHIIEFLLQNAVDEDVPQYTEAALLLLKKNRSLPIFKTLRS